MAQYRYVAQTAEGKKKKGYMIAADEVELQQRLHEEGSFLISAKEAEKKKKQKELKAKVLCEFSRELGTLVGAGVPLVRALNIISIAESVKPKERAIYEELSSQIRKGIALSEAMENANGPFPALMIYMYRSAETTGNLEEVCRQMAIYYEKEHRMNSKISASLVYPKILTGLIIGVVMVLCKFVLPQFTVLFESSSTALPTPTKILLGFSNFVDKYWLGIIVVGVAIYVGLKLILQKEKVRYGWDRTFLKLPLIGKLQKTICTARFARTLSSLYSSGVPIISSMQIARKTIGNEYLDQSFDEIIPYVRAGNDLSAGLRMTDGFNTKLADTIHVGEETGSMDTMLISTADSLDYDADIAISKMVSYIEPVMLIIMGIVVAFVLIALFSALTGSYDAVSNLS